MFLFSHDFDEQTNQELTDYSLFKMFSKIKIIGKKIPISKYSQAFCYEESLKLQFD